nr:MAG TPA: hypothetical protein [Caudoviricetes sp.]
MAEDISAKIVGRHQRVAFLNTDTTGSVPKYERMTKFTAITNSKNPKEYSRQYVDKESEDTDVVGYSPAIDYSFDRHTNTPVHDVIAKIHDGELTGSNALVDILSVDLFDGTEAEGFVARKRTYAVIPDSDGDGTDALVYSGSFKSKSNIETVKVTVSADGLTATIKTV